MFSRIIVRVLPKLLKAVSVNKRAVEDTVLPTADGKGLAVPAGTDLQLSVLGLHYNRTRIVTTPNHPLTDTEAKYWPDPTVFNPERFMNPDWPRENFFAFSAGARSCIGRRCV